MKYIFVSGGVVSGLGKGISAASLAFLLKSRGYKVTPVKIDMYLNVDAGTIRPAEHGEVFVTHDGIESDEDLGHYERFLHENISRKNYITTGQIYQEVIRRERAFEYEGEDVEAIPHVTDEIISRIKDAGEAAKADIVIVELGGTVGEYQNGIFYEAARILKLNAPHDVIHIHVTYIPYLESLGELKSKPAQTSVRILNGMGIQPDVMVARSEKPLDRWRLDRLSLFCNMEPDRIFAAPNVDNIYKVPLVFHASDHHLASTCLRLLSLRANRHRNIEKWENLIKTTEKKGSKQIDIVMVGKYFVVGKYDLIDAYVSVVEALKHASWKTGVDINIHWLDSSEIDKNGTEALKQYDAIVVPQGWGKRGTEGKIKAIEYARKNKVPYLGLCFGMQMATIEFARNVLKMTDANSEEVNKRTKHPVVHIMPHQKEYLEKNQYGGTIRLGAYPCKIKKGTLLEKLYKQYESDEELPWEYDRDGERSKKDIIYERHRHRYEFNNEFKEQFEKKGFIISGTSPDGLLVESIELSDHPFFIGTQYHPEYISRPLTPHPIFMGFVKAASKHGK